MAYAADLWSNPTENMRFFETLGLTNRQIVPIKADASEGLPFAEEFFDAVVSIDSYNYFGPQRGVFGCKTSAVCEARRVCSTVLPWHEARLPRKSAGMPA